MNLAQYQSSFLSKSKRNFFVFIIHGGFFHGLFKIFNGDFGQLDYFYFLLYTIGIGQYYLYKFNKTK